MARKRQNNGAVYTLNGVTEIAPNLIFAPRDPINGQDEMEIGTEWINTVTQNYFIKGPGAIWTDLAGGPGNGTYTSITTVGNGLPVPGGAMVALQGSFVALLGDLDIQAGNALAPNGTATALSGVFDSANAGDVLIAGGSLELQNYPDAVLITQNQGFVDPAQLQGADGQVIIAATSGQPQWASITSTQGSISFTTGPNTLDIDITDNAITTQIDADSGSATPTGDLIEVIGGTNLTTAAIGRVVSLRLNDSVTLVGSMAADSLSSGGSLTVGTDLTVTTGDAELDAGRWAIATGSGEGINVSTDVFVRSSGAGTITTIGRYVTYSVTGGQNTLYGANAARNLTSGSRNVMIRTSSYNLAAATQNDTTLIPRSDAGAGTIGTRGVGIHVLGNHVIGQNTVRVGGTGSFTMTNESTLFLGTGSGTNDNCLGIPWVTGVGDTNFINLGVASTTATYFGGGSTVYGAAVGGTNAALLADTANILGTTVSSRRYKQNIKDMGDQSAPILKLRPVTFHYKKDIVKRKQYGLIAEEVDKAFPYLVNYDQEGKPHSVRYHELPVMMLNELQKLNHKLAALERRYN